MKKDGQLAGLIMISKNLSDFTPELTSQYLDYFKKNNFKIEVTKNISFENANQFVLDLAQSGKIDYMIREGHSESASETLVSLDKKTILYKMTKNDESIFLLASSTSKSKGVNTHDEGYTTSIGMSDLGSALRKRPNRISELLYFN